MKPTCISNNAVMIFDNNIEDIFKPDEISKKIKLAYSDKDLGLGETVLPNFKAVYATQAEQLQVVGQSRNLIISINEINKTGEIDVDFIKLVTNIRESFLEASKIIQHGFNFSFVFKESETEDGFTKLREKFMNTESSLLQDKDLVFYMPNYAYKEDSAQYTFTYSLQEELITKEKRITVTVNVHFDSDMTEDATKLHEKYQNAFNKVSAEVTL